MTEEFRVALSRRDLVKMLSTQGLLLPFLPSLLGAKELKLRRYPKRLVILQTAHGQYADHWYPSSEIPLRRISSEARGIALSDIPGPISLVFDKTFDRFKSKINLLRGLDIISTDEVAAHGPYKILDGAGLLDKPGATIDQVVAFAKSFYQNEPLLRSLHLLNKGDPTTKMRMSFNPKTGPIVPIDHVLMAYNRVFSATYDNPMVKGFLESEYKNRFGRLSLAEEDRKKLIEHYEVLRAMGTSPQQCTYKLKPESFDTDSKRLDYYVKLISAVIKCDISRVITLNITDIVDNKPLTYVKGTPRYHTLSHEFQNPSALEQFLQAQNFHGQVVAKLLAELDEVEDFESGKTYLDNSLVMWVTENCVRKNDLGSYTVHASIDMPMFMAGSAGGALRTGYFLDFQKLGVSKRLIYKSSREQVGLPECVYGEPCEFRTDYYPFLGRPINELLVTIMIAMGLDYSDFETQGRPGFGNYDSNYFGQYDISDRRRLVSEIFNG